ncbi:MAG: hypothetical protein AB1571_00240 [Nanoarchaeota archaeon]
MSLKEILKKFKFKKYYLVFEAEGLITSEKGIKIPQDYDTGQGSYITVDKIIDKIINNQSFENTFYKAKQKKFIRIIYKKIKISPGSFVDTTIITNDKDVLKENQKFGWEKSYKTTRELKKLL